jgi:hypothetical protein
MDPLSQRCCGLDVHKDTVVACLRLASDGEVTIEVRTFKTTTEQGQEALLGLAPGQWTGAIARRWHILF